MQVLFSRRITLGMTLDLGERGEAVNSHSIDNAESGKRFRLENPITAIVHAMNSIAVVSKSDRMNVDF